MKAIMSSGKRKSAIARATINKGTGLVKINNLNLNVFTPEIARLKLQEPLIIAGKVAQKYDISLNISGGGVMSQTIAARLAIARGLVEAEPKLKEEFLNYDRLLLVADIRRKESSKPNSHGKARAKRQKSYR
ncbi:MAG: 30S ribosomal protein S9 [Candidatus Woesearchaeota archaeon]